MRAANGTLNPLIASATQTAPRIQTRKETIVVYILDSKVAFKLSLEFI